MANGAFTLKGFESPEEVQARIGKVQQGALNTGGGFSGIEGAIYNAAAQGQAGIGKAIQTATGYEDPAVKKARRRQELMSGTDFTNKDSIKSAIDAAGDDLDLKVKLSSMYNTLEKKVGKKSIKEVKEGDFIQTYMQNADGTLGKLIGSANRFSKRERGLTGEGASEFDKALGRQKAKSLMETEKKAINAAKGLESAVNVQNLIAEGVRLGKFSKFTTNLLASAEALGWKTGEGDEVSRTQTVMAEMGKGTLAIMGSGDLGAGSGLSEKDLEFAELVAAGNIDLTEKTIKRMLDINAIANRNIIKRHNDTFKRNYKGKQFDLTVETPEYETYASKDRKQKVYNAQARAWLKKNPNHPDAAGVRAKLGTTL